MQRTQISLSVEQQDALARLAAARRVSQAAVLRDALDEVLAQERRSRHLGAVLASLGAFDSGTHEPVDYDAAFVETLP